MSVLNVVGLFLNFIGAVLLVFYESPKSEIGALLSTSAPSQKERERKRNIQRCLSRFALLLLTVGFGLQLIAAVNW